MRAPSGMLFIANKAFLFKYLWIAAGRFTAGAAGKFSRANFPARHRGRELAGNCARIALQIIRRMIRPDLGTKMAKRYARGPLIRSRHPPDELTPREALDLLCRLKGG
jgi:hypothetical protein